MMIKTNTPYCLAILLLLSSLHAMAASSDAAAMTSLQERITALEQQNAQILEQLKLLSGQDESHALPSPETGGDTNSLVASKAPVSYPEAVITESKRSKLSFYGFARADVIYDDSRPSSAQSPTYIHSEGPGEEQDGDFTMHPRLTRMGMNYSGPVLDSLGGAKLSARIETDFQNGGSESRARLRYRHAWAKLGWDRNSLLIGQTWDIISPLYPSVNADTMMWNTGNLGDRRMQIRYTHQATDNISLTAGVGLTGAINSQDLDANGVRDGEDAETPQVQARMAYAGEKIKLGVWGHYANEETEILFNGQNNFDSYSAGFDFDFRPASFASVKGEIWTGSGLGDVRGGIGQSININTGNEIDSHGGWVELGLKPASYYNLSVGFSIDDPDNDDLWKEARKLNRAWYMTNQFRLGSAFMFGLDYLHWKTNYVGLPEGTDNRLNLYSIYYF